MGNEFGAVEALWSQFEGVMAVDPGEGEGGKEEGGEGEGQDGEEGGGEVELGGGGEEKGRRLR